MKKKVQIKKANSLQWVFEHLESHPDFIQKKMFGCEAAYLGHQIVLVLADEDEPWNGALIPTDRSFHASICEEFKMLAPHPVLGKWLYLSQKSIDFEDVVGQITQYVLKKDPRFGVLPRPKKVKRR